MAVKPEDLLSATNQSVALAVAAFEADIDRKLKEDLDFDGYARVYLASQPKTLVAEALKKLYLKAGWGSVQFGVDDGDPRDIRESSCTPYVDLRR